MSTFLKVLEKYRKVSFSERDKGDRFERLMQAYLQTDPVYANRFKKVWLWNEFPGKEHLGSQDTGIDLVSLTNDGEYWAIQCKCYAEDAIIDKPKVDSFLATSSRKFKDEKGNSHSFSQRLWIETTGKHWGSNAEEAIKNQHPPVSRLNLYNLIDAPVDWAKLEKGIHGDASRIQRKKPLPHQIKACEEAQKYFKSHDRGKLIMACGTGKTYNSLIIAESETKGKGLILFLVPSIALVGQSLREWSANAEEPINAICICSDPEVSKKRSKNDDSDNLSVVDLALPASTNVKDIVHQFQALNTKGKGITVVFSTYQSIDVIAKAQKELAKVNDKYAAFDMIICDEAHRTTGVTLAGDDESSFMKVHDNKFIKGKKRLYMTATPRLYNDDSKSRAAQAEAVLCSMDDPKLYGEEIYRIGFGEAVERNLLTDYKVLILTLNQNDIPPAVQKIISTHENEIKTDDISKLIGCVNALSKQILGDQGIVKDSDPEPMRRAVAFCSSIAVSKTITETFNTATDAYLNELPAEQKGKMVSISSKHIDGTYSAPQRDELLSWLKAEGEANECRVLTNVRCLSEGVDVPSLDAVMFLSARNSQVDVVQSVGRVMRKSPGKKYGYIIIPVVVPSDVEPDKALDDNERYRVVWTVLNALRAHDDRFNATVNKIELNKQRPSQILVGRPEYSWENGVPVLAETTSTSDFGHQIALQFEQLQSVVFARMVQKVGDRRYWEQWARNVAEIAKRQEERIKKLIKDDEKHRKAFEKFLKGLQKNINPSITSEEAVDMLSQHIITKPVFEALFEDYSFVKNNPISVSMQKMLDLLEEQALEKDADTLFKFYESVKMRAAGIDNAEGKQKIVVELYDKFFKTAFPKMVEKLGIVYTPVEVVDFIIHSVNDILKKEFDRELTDENIHILDPFTGTGTFVTRLLQSGLIDKKDLPRKYDNEIHANEIVLLAYYIAAVNIENAFHDLAESKEYKPFEGICLTDTFQLNEIDSIDEVAQAILQENSSRIILQKKAPLRVIMGNPPYSGGQKSANDNAANQAYEKLDAAITKKYVDNSSSGLNKASYDSYKRAFRWSTDRLDPQNGGIIAFVTNGKWISENSSDGFRKAIESEFCSIYVFDLRGDQRTSGELSRKEGGKIFGSGSRSKITITLLVKKPEAKGSKATIYYSDIGDYLTREEKLRIIKDTGSLGNPKMQWEIIKPNEHGDWLGLRNDLFSSLTKAAPLKNFDKKTQSFFTANGPGISSGRDFWVYNASKRALIQNLKNTIAFYNEQTKKFQNARKKDPEIKLEKFIDTDEKKISWTDNLKKDIEKGVSHEFDESKITVALYRPFNKRFIYYDKSLIERPGLNRTFFAVPNSGNLIITATGTGASKDFSVLITNELSSYDLLEKTQCYPLFYFEEVKKDTPELFQEDTDAKFIKRDGISDFILSLARTAIGKDISKEDIFYYVYGFLHSNHFRSKFANDLKKVQLHMSLVENAKDFWAFSKAGRSLADLHLKYETVPAASEVSIVGDDVQHQMDAYEFYRVEKMRFPKKDQKDTIIYNSRLTITNIPDKAYDYIVNGKSAIEWIMERYAVTTHKDSGITNDPNDWSREVESPSYIFDLLQSVINVSLKTVEIVKNLPQINFTEITSSSEICVYKEHEMVQLLEKVDGVRKGAIGTIVHCYEGKDAYEVEFDGENDRPVVLTLLQNQIKKNEKI